MRPSAYNPNVVPDFEVQTQSEGTTLLDEFAGLAMGALMPRGLTSAGEDYVSERAYKMALSMLRAREVAIAEALDEAAAKSIA